MPKLEVFLGSVFTVIQTEKADQNKMKDQKNSEIGHFSCSVRLCLLTEYQTMQVVATCTFPEIIRPDKFLYSCVSLVSRLVVKHDKGREALLPKL